jgi:hypothetical protein
MNFLKVSLVFAVCLAILSPALGAYDRIFVLIFENTDRAVALGDAHFDALLSRGLLLDNFYATTHPSQPNYIALVGGDLLGVSTNNMYNLTDTFLANLLDAKGVTWKSYQENYPGGCFINPKSSDLLYVRKHNPFMSFTYVSEDTEGRCLNNVPGDQLQTDVDAETLPKFMFYTPNMDNGAHDTDITFAGNWLNGFLPPLLDNPKFMNGTLVIVTFDEGYTNSAPENNKVYTLLIGEGIPEGKKTSERYDHYSLLRTIEDNFELGTLERNDATATPVNFTLYDTTPEPQASPSGEPSPSAEPSAEPNSAPIANEPVPGTSPNSAPSSKPPGTSTPKTQSVSSAYKDTVSAMVFLGIALKLVL